MAYLAVNSSNDSSACGSLHRVADAEKARCALQARGPARLEGTRRPALLTLEKARTKDMARQWRGGSCSGEERGGWMAGERLGGAGRGCCRGAGGGDAER